VGTPAFGEQIHAFGTSQATSNQSRIVRIALGRDDNMAMWSLELVAITTIVEKGISVQSGVQRVHKDDEQKRRQRIALLDGSLHGKLRGRPKGSANVGLTVVKTGLDKFDKGLWKLDSSQTGQKTIVRNGVVGTGQVVEYRNTFLLVQV